MFVRCDRCRSVFELDDARASAPAVSCGRCDHVFAPQPVRFVGVLGTIGGAAAEAGAPSADEITAPRIRMKKEAETPPKSKGRFRGGSLVILFVSGLGLAVAGAWALRSLPAPVPPASVESLAMERRGLQLLRRDDDESLEQALAAFGNAALSSPQRREFRAMRVVATTLLAASLRDRARDLAAELDSLEREATVLSDDDADGHLQRLASVRRRIVDVQEALGPSQLRGDALLRDSAAELTALATLPESTGAAETALAHAMFAAAARQPERVDEHLRSAQGRADLASFAQLARGMSRLTSEPDAARAAEARAYLAAALESDPSLLRARVLLARLALTRPTPDPVDAFRQLEAIRDANEDHPAVDVLVARVDRAKRKLDDAVAASPVEP